MPDLLYQAAFEYRKLKNIIYKIVLGRKNKTYYLKLHFPEETFFHLAGLQHLTDLTFPSKNKQRIYKEILNGKITCKTLEKSVFYRSWFIEERLSILPRINEIFESKVVTYLINPQQYIQYTNIKADYLCEQKNVDEILYLFLAIEKNNPTSIKECRAISFFKKHRTDYTKGTSKTTVLLIEKIENGKTTQIFRNPNFREDI